MQCSIYTLAYPIAHNFGRLLPNRKNIGGLTPLHSKSARMNVIGRQNFGGLLMNCLIHQRYLLPMFCAIIMVIEFKCRIG